MADMLGLDGKTIAVTGAANGIGRATAELAGALGAEVIAIDRQPVDLPGVTEVTIDLGDQASIRAGAAALAGRRIDGLCNIAAVPSGSGLPPHRTVAINYAGTRLLTELLLPLLAPEAGIVCTSSGAARAWDERLDALRPLAACATFAEAEDWALAHADPADAYGQAKRTLELWALGTLLPQVARAAHQRVNVVAPGMVETGMLHRSRTGTYDQLRSGWLAVVHRLGQPRDLAWPILFLASPAAGFVSGQVLSVDGGMAALRPQVAPAD